MPSNDVSRIKQLTGGFEKFDFMGSLEWMPDNRIMYGSLLNGKPVISVMNADGSNSQQMISAAITAAVSPDGRFLVSRKGSKESGDVGLYLLDLSEMSEVRLTDGIFPVFSPDSKYVVFKRYGDDQKAPILRVGIDGGEPILITDNPNLNYPAISPDGKIIALANRSTNNLVLLSLEGGEEVKKFDAKFQPMTVVSKAVLQWTPDGRAVNYLAMKDNVSNIWRQPIDGGNPQQVTDFKDGLIFGFAFSPDGSQLALSRGTINSDVVLIDNQK
jgi:Tol biopolymer transport system component